MLTREEFLHLYEKSINGKCSVAENELLESYKDHIDLSDAQWDDNNASKQEAYDRIWERLVQSRRSYLPLKKNNKFIWAKIAAVLFLGCPVFWLVTKRPKLLTPLPYSTTRRSPVVIKPGSNKALLTLANGSRIVLNDAKNGKLTMQSGTQVVKAKGGLLIYKGQNKRPDLASSAMNTITTPRGGQYQLVLEDGTKVWLNAASTLKFPPQFTGHERKVELQGEAYFEVHKNPLVPFVVKMASQEVLVLGTHFNISAYEEESVVKTSLLEGKVTISAAGKKAALLPGQEAVNNRQGLIKVNQADVTASIAWKNGLFQFNNASIEEVMRQIARWYDVKVSYDGRLPVKQFTGTVSRQVGMEEMLSMLRYTGIHFKVSNDQILVTP